MSVKPALGKYVTTQSNGVEIQFIPIPDGWVEIDSFHPTTTPWDCAGLQHQREYLIVLEEAGIVGLPLVTRHRRISPQGTGPNGRVRFGDDMMPGIYKIIVAQSERQEAEEALRIHNDLVKDWIYKEGPEPAACRKAYTG